MLDDCLHEQSRVWLGQYDDGEISGISDVDRDGNIEVWFSAEWGECDGEECILKVSFNYNM